MRAERVSDRIVVIFELDIEIKSLIIATEKLHQDRVFEMAGSFSSTQEGISYANVNVKDYNSRNKLSVHIRGDELLISRGKETTFEDFRDYILFIENSFRNELTHCSGD